VSWYSSLISAPMYRRAIRSPIHRDRRSKSNARHEIVDERPRGLDVEPLRGLRGERHGCDDATRVAPECVEQRAGKAFEGPDFDPGDGFSRQQAGPAYRFGQIDR
jgi:hypothetical protein